MEYYICSVLWLDRKIIKGAVVNGIRVFTLQGFIKIVSQKVKKKNPSKICSFSYDVWGPDWLHQETFVASWRPSVGPSNLCFCKLSWVLMNGWLKFENLCLSWMCKRLSCAGLRKRLPLYISISQISDVFSGCQGENVKDLFRKWLEYRCSWLTPLQ